MKNLELKREIVQYEKDGKVKEFTNYFVDIMGIHVQLRTSDNTGRQLLEQVYDNLENK